MRFTDILLEKGLIDQSKLAKLFAKAEENNVSIEKSLQSEGISEEVILNAKSEISGLTVKKVLPGQISFEMLKKIPEEAARQYRFIPFGVKEGFLEVGMVDPVDMEAKRALQFIVSRMNLPIKTFIVSEKDYEDALEGYKGLGGEVSRALGDLEMELSGASSASVAEAIQADLSKGAVKGNKIVEDAPVTKIVAVILRHALEGNASDIHIEAVTDKVKIRFRVDGVLHTSIVLPLTIHEAIVSRIKILTNMKIDEKRKPQDGRFEARIEGRDIDFRVSTFPSFFGEKVVIRILDREKGVKTLEELGFSPDHLKIVRTMIDKPYGLILLTGPTGSGKTTSLYAMIKELDREANNVVSLEDPIEYNIEGLSQSQVRPEIGYDFASGLRSILRQDPDVIMVGEIRDKETAAMAIHAALTGHLVLSTLHTNSAAGVVPRLIDMGVDPYLIAPTLLMVIGQRLVKSLCSESKKEVLLEGAFKEMAQNEFNKLPDEAKKKITSLDKVYEGVSSPSCPMGSRGRIGAFEIIYKTPDMENLILKKPSDQDILAEARKQGMITIKEDGLIKMFSGFISFEEFLKL
ncbi:MAG: GspE/PulE family protein [Patescibacteria group bacterium]|mgnify:FL=1